MESQPTNNIGTLYELPPEIRGIIWAYLFSGSVIPPQPGIELPPNSNGNLGILRTCRQLYDEVAYDLYKRPLMFSLFPQYEYRNWFTIRNRGAKWVLRDPAHGKALGFQNLPYERLKELRITLYAPDASDPGQLICLWKKVRELVKFLESCREGKVISKLIISLAHPRGENQWYSNGNAIKSIQGPGDLYDEDIRVILLEFCRLRNVQMSAIRMPIAVPEHYRGLLHILNICMSRKEKLNTKHQPHADPGWSDIRIQYGLDVHFCRFDRALDSCPGKTAGQMRLDRFVSWFPNEFDGKSEYIDELVRMADTFDSGPFHQSPGLVSRRYKDMRIYAFLSKHPLDKTSDYEIRTDWWRRYMSINGIGTHLLPGGFFISDVITRLYTLTLGDDREYAVAEEDILVPPGLNGIQENWWKDYQKSIMRWNAMETRIFSCLRGLYPNRF